MSRKAEDFLIAKGWDKNNPTVGGVFFQGIVELLDEYEAKQCNISDVVGRSEQFYCKDESYHKTERCTKQCSDCLYFVNNLQ